MKSRKAGILHVLLFAFTSVSALLLLSAVLSSKADPEKYYLVSFSGLLFPFLLLLNILIVIFFFFYKKAYAILPFAILIISIPQAYSTFPLTVFNSESKSPDKVNLRIISWNVGLMNYSAKVKETAIAGNKKIFDALYKERPDILCLQEFFTAVIPDRTYNFIDSLQRHLDLPYYYFSRDYPRFQNKFYSGTIILSRYKITDTLKLNFEDGAGSVVKANISMNNDTVSIISSRLRSIGFNENDYAEVEGIKELSATVPASRTLLSKMKYAYIKRKKQADLIDSMITSGSYPVIFAGDLNDVTTSYTYETIKDDMKDAWVKKGNGLGRTFRVISPTLRIDYIFYSDYFRSLKTRRILTDASDHFGILTDLEINKKNP